MWKWLVFKFVNVEWVMEMGFIGVVVCDNIFVIFGMVFWFEVIRFEKLISYYINLYICILFYLI